MTATITPLALILFGLAAGVALGLAHFASLARVTTLWLSGRAPAFVIALHIARFAVLAAGLYGLARLGAGPLLAGALGVLAARAIVLSRIRKAP